MKKTTLLISFILFTLYSYSQSKISFKKVTKLEDIKSNSKTIFLDFYAEWCTPCKKMEQEAFADSIIAAYYNDNFINYQVDIDSELGKLLTQKYQISGFPTSLYLDRKGNVVGRKVGYKNKNNFFNHGQSIPKKTPEILTHLSSVPEMYKHIKSLDSINVEDHQLYNKFFSALSENQLDSMKYKVLLCDKLVYLDFKNNGYQNFVKNIVDFYQDSSLINNHLFITAAKNKDEETVPIQYNVKFLSAVFIPLNLSINKAKSTKDVILFEDCILMQDSILKTIYRSVPKHVIISNSKNRISFYGQDKKYLKKFEDQTNNLYKILVENISAEDIIAENERIYEEAKNKLLRQNPDFQIDIKTKAILNNYIQEYKQNLDFLLNSYKENFPNSPRIEEIEKLKNDINQNET